MAIEEAEEVMDCKVVLEWWPFFLNPDAPHEPIEKREYYGRNHGGAEGVAKMEKSLGKAFAEMGLAYTIEGKIANTFQSHRLVELASQQGKATETVDALLNKYFCEGKNSCNDIGVLVETAQQVGIEGDIPAFFQSDALQREVFEMMVSIQQNIAEKDAQTSFRGVPHYVLQGQIGEDGSPVAAMHISGAQSSQGYFKALQQLAKQVSASL